ncbi:MAG: hypothetical protein ACK4YP_12205 [Myxococcota bacterium]
MLAIAALSAGCTPDVVAMYEAEKSAALEIASERPKDWDPDLVLDIAGPDFEEAVETAIKAALSKEQEPLVFPVAFGIDARMRPVLSIEEASLKASDACASCLSFDAVLVGKASWSVGPASGTIPLDVGAQGIFALEVADGHIIQATPRSVTSVRVRVTDLAGLKMNPSKQIQDWLTSQLQGRIPRIKVVELDTSALPLRDLRLRSQGGAVRVEALTNVPGAKPVGKLDAPADGVRLAISESALVGLARRAAFERGELTMDVYADPLEMNVEGSEFTLDLRLWRLVGRGWWRDYRVYGDLQVQGGVVRMVAKRTEELGHSPGAGLVDPLAALFEGRILEEITGAVTQSLPSVQKQDFGAVQLRAETNSVSGRDGTLVVDGKLMVKSPTGGGQGGQGGQGGTGRQR